MIFVAGDQGNASIPPQAVALSRKNSQRPRRQDDPPRKYSV